MRATVEFVERKFDEFNRLCFGGRLEPLPVKLSDAKTFMGKVEYKWRTVGGRREKYDFVMRVNTRVDLPEDELEDIILHEMIHYYLGVNRLEDTAPHGKLFLSLMNQINERYGRHITVSRKYSVAQTAQTVDARPRLHIVAVVTMADGRVGVKVIPRVEERILNYYNGMLSWDKVKAIDLFLTSDPFFNSFPNSGALKAYIVDKRDIDAHLTDSMRLECDGRTVRVPRD